MTHTCSIKHVIIGKHANRQVGKLLEGYHRVLLVADTNTYQTCGPEIEAQIGDKLESVLIYRRDGLLIPNEEAVEELSARITGQTDLVLGTKAKQEDKLAFDPDRKKRRAFYGEVVEAFEDYVVFVGGSSSFDMAPKPYNKYHALDLYCKEHGLSHENVVFVGDDYGLGGNDESVYQSDIPFICVDDYRDFPKLMEQLL